MISVIISSANSELLSQVTTNIEQTIGVPFELIAIDNSDGKKGICEVYNTGAQKAQYEILCFVHEDIILRTENWGRVLAGIFEKNPDIGLVGVAGSSYKTLSPSNWGGHWKATQYYNFEQYFKHEPSPPEHHYRNPNNVKLAHVACIDGVFMATTKQVFGEHKFDDNLFKGFHIYDVDYSLNVGQQYKIVVTYDIFLTHLSEGAYDKAWMNANLLMHDKWYAHLPINIAGLDITQQQKIEKQCFNSLINELLEFNIPLYVAYKFLFKEGRMLKLYPKVFWKIYFHLFKLRLKGKR